MVQILQHRLPRGNAKRQFLFAPGAWYDQTMSAPILDESAIVSNIQSHRHAYGRNEFVLDDLRSILDSAENELAPFAEEARIMSSLSFIFGHRPKNPRGWQNERSSRATFTRKTGGWALEDLDRVAMSPKDRAVLKAQPFALLEFGGQAPINDCAARFFDLLDRGCFAVDVPLPGSFSDLAHREPLSALAFCASRSRPEWVRELLARGADPNGASAYGKRPLHFCLASAHQRGSLECAELLLGAGADPSATSRSGKTPWASLSASLRAEPSAVLAKQAQDSGKVAAILEKAARRCDKTSGYLPAPEPARSLPPKNRL